MVESSSAPNRLVSRRARAIAPSSMSVSAHTVTITSADDQVAAGGEAERADEHADRAGDGHRVGGDAGAQQRAATGSTTRASPRLG